MFWALKEVLSLIIRVRSSLTAMPAARMMELVVFWPKRFVEVDRFLFPAEGSAEWMAKQSDPKNDQKVRANG